jgi:hypothetical protein
MRSIYVIALSCSASVSLFSCQSRPACIGVVPLCRAHAHNDYKHSRPLVDALAHGFTSVEADIFLIEGELYVAHAPHEVRPERTLRSLYLDPLRKRIALNGGCVWPNGPLFTLLIDIKSAAAPTYEVLDRILAEYQDIFTSYSVDGRNDKAVLAIVSGNRPRQLMESQELRYAAYDGRLADLESDAPANLIPLVSDNWTRHFTWKGIGAMPAEERLKLRRIVQAAHRKGRRVRFWATPDNPSIARQALWRELILAGVDLINTDDLDGLQQFLLANQAR